MFSSEESSSVGVKYILSSTDRNSENTMGEVTAEYQVPFYGEEDWGDSIKGTDLFCPDSCFLQDEDYLAEGFMFSKYQDEQEKNSDYGLLNGTQIDMDSPPLETCLEEMAKPGEIPTVIQDVEAKKDKDCPISFAAIELLKNYSSGLKRMDGVRVVAPSNDGRSNEVSERKLSTDEIMRIAGARFIQSSSKASGVPSMLSHPFESSFCGLSHEEKEDVELVELLLSCAEKIGYKQFERGGKLLNRCEQLCSNTGNSVRRLIYYFCEALREKVDKETGRNTSKGLWKQQPFDPDEAMMSLNATHHAIHEKLPFSQLSVFAGIQAIVENVGESKKIHIIDLRIRSGFQWTILMQALASRHESQLELLKITALGTTSKQPIEVTRDRLLSFAQTMKVPLSFKILMVSEMSHLKQDLFEMDSDETVAVYSSFSLRSMLYHPDQLESVMRVIRSFNPCVMVMTEVEANHNSPAFASRFIGALFFYGAYFDCLETFMKTDNENRMVGESSYFGQGIRNVVAAEGQERKIRHVTLDVWRAFFARFGMEDTELSSSSLYQAKLILKKFSCEDSCTVDFNGKCLIIGWKGTPIHSLSVWKFL